ncbi:helix-turn-helix domain-containing protein [Nocardia sp. CDC160]|uniref:helix-turn-helix domain-containing protein n=1 Tax=Nocardia sp. CDC160 TaxID=3112166 RepID=UPI002DBB8008|nr:helix-turn-helix transcriptional regulator [Nocardia sp. CDC160]MEC3915530.1 helix-turn-helix transcriptional regulator [Nocardia sp. CDC160]
MPTAARSDTDDGRYVGSRVAAIRKRRGMTQQMLADQTGISRGAIAKYENGERPVDSRKTLHSLAKALQCDVRDLTGHDQDRFDPRMAEFHAAVPDIEVALWTAGNTTPTGPLRSLEELAAMSNVARDLRINCQYGRVAPMLAPMLTDCYQHARDTTGAQQETAWDVLSTVADTVAKSLRAWGYPALSWTAADEAEKAAQHLGGTAVTAAAAFDRSQVLLSRPGALSRALQIAEDTAKLVTSEAQTRGELETLGMLHLQAGLVTASLGGDPDPHLDEAAELATRLSAAPAGRRMLRNPTFGANNVALWRMSSAMERRDASTVIELAPTVDPDVIPAKGRRAQYFVELGRAYAMEKQWRASLAALLRAEHTAPQHVRSMSVVRELVGHMMRIASRDLAKGDLGRLAQRVGAIPR